jgi:hypothetical protein
MTVLKFEGNQPCKKRCGVKLSDDRLNIGEAARQRLERNDVGVTYRCQRYKAEIDQIFRHREIIPQRRETGEGVGRPKGHETVQRDEHKSDIKIEQYGPNDSVERYLARRNDGASHNDVERLYWPVVGARSGALVVRISRSKRGDTRCCKERKKPRLDKLP